MAQEGSERVSSKVIRNSVIGIKIRCPQSSVRGCVYMPGGDLRSKCGAKYKPW